MYQNNYDLSSGLYQGYGVVTIILKNKEPTVSYPQQENMIIPNKRKTTAVLAGLATSLDSWPINAADAKLVDHTWNLRPRQAQSKDSSLSKFVFYCVVFPVVCLMLDTSYSSLAFISTVNQASAAILTDLCYL